MVLCKARTQMLVVVVQMATFFELAEEFQAHYSSLLFSGRVILFDTLLVSNGLERIRTI